MTADASVQPYRYFLVFPIMIKVAIVQYRLLHYRLRLFELLRARLSSAGIELQLIYGQATRTERSRNDEGIGSQPFSASRL